MGAWADSLFTVLMSWVRALVNGIWALFSSDHTTILEFLGKNWLAIAVVLIAAGLVIDWLVWLVRWQPYHLWARRIRRLLRIPEPEDEEDERPRRKATAAQRPAVRRQPEVQIEPEDEAGNEDWLPLAQPDEEMARQAMEQADSVPDEELRAYPGMRYGASGAPVQSTDDTLRYAAVHAEGPGAAEVARRRGEIDAWQQQMQEEARRQAEAERARRAQEGYEAEQARLAQEAYEAEQARRAQEAYEAEQARRAQEAYEAEQARLAQEEYERQLAEYERQKAQYERDLAEYERQKAAYDAQLAAQHADVQQASLQAGAQTAHRRRSTGGSVPYGDYVTGEMVGELPDPPAWPQTPELPQPATERPAKEKRARKDSGMMAKMAKMLEPEEEEIAGVRSLPPRVSVSDAYKPAKQPQQSGRRRR